MALLLLAGAGAAAALAGPQCRAQTAAGPVAGRPTAGSCEYLGIPYATHERWRPPRDPPARSETLDASRWGPCCPQCAGRPAFAGQAEQCLNLNVFAPRGQGQAAGLRPVLVFIPGGGGSHGCSGEGIPPLYNGSNLIQVAASLPGGQPAPVVVT